MRSRDSIAGIIKIFKEEYYRQRPPTGNILRTFGALEKCRTAALGGHIDKCPSCSHIAISYNSCRNRHCPLCQGREREKWIRNRKEDTLDVNHFHLVFTLPDHLNALFLFDKTKMYSLLFKAARQTIEYFADAQGIQPGMTAMLHTWGSNLQFHPHLHCMIPAGGLDKEGKWKCFSNANNKNGYLFAVKAMSMVFRAKFMAALTRLNPPEKSLRKKLFDNPWVVFCKRPLKVGDVIDYLGRYSHRIAISNRRIVEVSDTHVTFQYKDYKSEAAIKNMTIEGVEFLRRFALHILPPGFVRIRHYGFMASCNKKKLQSAKNQTQKIKTEKNLDCSNSKEKKKDIDEPLRVNSFLCPICKKDYMVCLEIIPSIRAPPKEISTYS